MADKKNDLMYTDARLQQEEARLNQQAGAQKMRTFCFEQLSALFQELTALIPPGKAMDLMKLENKYQRLFLGFDISNLVANHTANDIIKALEESLNKTTE